MSSKLLQAPFLIALLILCISLSVSILAFTNINMDNETSEGSFALRSGKNLFSVWHREECIGIGEVSLYETDSVIMFGTLLLKEARSSLLSKIFIELQFNSERALKVGGLLLQRGEERFSVELQGPLPLNVSAKGLLFGKPLDKKVTSVHALMIPRSSKGKFVVEYPFFNYPFSPSVKKIVTAFGARSAVKLRQEREGYSSCRESNSIHQVAAESSVISDIESSL
jgi:hypothetical protein